VYCFKYKIFYFSICLSIHEGMNISYNVGNMVINFKWRLWIMKKNTWWWNNMVIWENKLWKCKREIKFKANLDMLASFKRLLICTICVIIIWKWFNIFYIIYVTYGYHIFVGFWHTWIIVNSVKPYTLLEHYKEVYFHHDALHENRWLLLLVSSFDYIFAYIMSNIPPFSYLVSFPSGLTMTHLTSFYN